MHFLSQQIKRSRGPHVGPARRCDFRRSCSMLLVTLFLATLVFSASKQLAAQESTILPQRECQVKYAFLYSFGLMTRWPEESYQSTNNQFVIGVLGEKPFAADLDRISQTKKILGRNIVIRRFRSPAEITSCHILFVTASVSAESRKATLEQLAGHPVLLVGETSNFAATGGVVNFYIDGDNVRFELNATIAKQQQLVIDPRLSKLAKLIGGTDSAVGETPRPTEKSKLLPTSG